MNTRARFEEIWPVPLGVYWWIEAGEYNAWSHEDGHMADEWNTRLDTFTRCQETTDAYVSLVGELVKEVEDAYSAYGVMPECVDRAKQIMEQRK